MKKGLMLFIVMVVCLCPFYTFGDGDPEAQYLLAVAYFEGVDTAQDMAKAVKWFRIAAENGHAGAKYYLGLCYEKGYGVAKNIDEAIRWYREAERQGFSKATEALRLLQAK